MTIRFEGDLPIGQLLSIGNLCPSSVSNHASTPVSSCIVRSSYAATVVLTAIVTSWLEHQQLKLLNTIAGDPNPLKLRRAGQRNSNMCGTIADCLRPFGINKL
jgi:hypothetical protein